MNFLAHCLINEQAAAELTDPNAVRMLIAGGFLGDFVKGSVPDHLPAALSQGIRLHRRIDAYSNQNDAIRRSCNRFPPALRRLAPALVDVIADHLLAQQWHRYHPLPLNIFSRQAYRHIAASTAHLSPRGVEFLQWMMQHDLLARYTDWETTYRGMKSITRRLQRQELDEALQLEVRPLLPALQQDFDEYFPDLITHATLWLSAEAQCS